MKKNKLTSLLLIFLLVINVSCNDYLDINTDPNNPTEVPPEVILPVVLVGGAFANNNELNRYGSTIMNYTAGAGGGPAEYDDYILTGGDFNNQWSFELYNGVILDSETLIEAAEEVGGRHYSGIAKIMQAYGFALATDLWGDIPYSQSPSTTINRPIFDAQEDIYQGNAELEIQSLFDLVREGIADLQAESSVSPGSEDFVYGGDIDQWTKAGYTLMLKLANTISNVNPTLATSVINEVLAADNFIEANSDDMNVTFGTQIGGQAPVHTYTNVSLFAPNLILSSRFQDLLEGNNDPRLPVFFTQIIQDEDTVFTSFTNGGNAADLPDNPDDYSQFNSYVTGEEGEGPVRLLTNFQGKFILAEAALTLPGVSVAGAAQAQTFYTEGITASMALTGFTDAEISTYLADNPSVATLSSDTEEALEQIIIQKYIAWTGNGLEAYNDWRRTGYPDFPENLNPQGVDGTRPIRLLYVNEERNNNPNTPEELQTNVPVWWDVN